MSLFAKKKVQQEPHNVPPAADERARQETAENNPWMSARKRHIDVYHDLASSVAQWRLATFVMLVLIVVCVLSNLSLARSVKIQPYVIQVDEHGYAIPVSEISASNVDARVVSAQIGAFIINSRARTSDIAAQLKHTENSYKSVALDSKAMTLLNGYYRESPPANSLYPVSLKILSVKPINNASYQASWTETVRVGGGKDQEFGYLGTFNVVVSPPEDYAGLVDNPLGVYITDYNIIRSY
ncbi:MAG: type IV secretion system protein [Synergistaceae bacterium]|jgi:type IV secretory pathway TrbF-like protein|nr:type IV secretion system protein [Synergistaceae bacterium]